MRKKIHTNRQLLGDLRRVARQLNRHDLSGDLYDDHGRYSHITICRRFGSWKAALLRVGLQPVHWMNISAGQLLDDIRRVAALLNVDRLRICQYLELGLYSRRIINRHFGRWHTAVVTAGLMPVTACRRLRVTAHQTPRTVNSRLRFLVFQRDHFRCVACGRSPATQTDVVLQADHKIPWDIGGESTMDNLQTLCSVCNSGKSNLPWDQSIGPPLRGGENPGKAGG